MLLSIVAWYLIIMASVKRREKQIRAVLLELSFCNLSLCLAQVLELHDICYFARARILMLQVVFDLRPARLTTARLYDRLDHTSYRTYTIIFALIYTCSTLRPLGSYIIQNIYDNFCPHIYIHVYMRFDLRPLRLTTGWSEPNAVVSRTLSV